VGGRGGTIQRLWVTFGSVALVVLVAACSGASPSPSTSLPASVSPVESATSTSPSAAASAIANSAPTSTTNIFTLLPVPQPADFVSQITCSGVIGASDAVAVVQLVGAAESGEVVLRDYADPLNPRTACTFGSNGPTQLIDARHVVIGGGESMAVVDLPEVSYHWFQVPYPKQFLAVGPKLDQVLWMTQSGTPGTDTVYLSTSAGDRVVANLPTPGRGRCGSSEFDSKVAAYTLSGSHLFVLNQPVPQWNSLVVVKGETALLSVIPPSGAWPDDGWPMMAVWSPTTETLYYRQGGDVWQWTEGPNAQLFLPDVSWINPTISADGAYLAYSVLRPDGLLHDVFLVDLARGGSPQRIGDGRRMPAFVNSSQLWFKSEAVDYGCGGTVGEQPLIYNVLDGTEAPSIIEWVLKVWPATSSNF